MRRTLVAVGRARDPALSALYADYAGRCRPPLILKEVEERKTPPPPDLKSREARLLRAALPTGATLVALDERGRTLDSIAFARKLGDWRDRGVADVAFVIGGADGLDPALVDSADLVLSLGSMTWPHMLVRVMIAEQLYRAETILSGHPYHRA